MNKVKIRPYIFIFIIALCFVVSVLFHYMTAEGSDASNREFSVLLAERVSDAIDAELNGPIQVSIAMAQDVYVQNLLENERSVPEKDMEASISRYLGALKEKMDYSDTYIISDRTRRHYSHAGIRKIINPERNREDVWYSLFVDSGKLYALNVDASKETENEWTVYIDTRITGSDGEILGVCGVALLMSDLQQILVKYEKVYGVKLSIVDEDGLVQADVDSINIEASYTNVDASEDSDEYVYTKKGEGGYTVTKYLPEFNWYLVVKNDGHGFVASGFDPKFLMISLALFLGTASSYILFFKNIVAGTVKKEASLTDELTGLWNRNYFKDVFGEHGLFNTTRYKTIAVYDIDSFKEANDTLNGDAVLKFVTECAQKVMGPKGEIFRWGGDEFVVLMEWSVDFAEGICRELCHEIEKDGRVTISVGVASVRISDTIKTNYYRAAQGCYLVKEMGGNGVKVCDL